MSKFKDFLLEMGRNRNQIIELIDSIQDEVQEHIWKIVVYRKSNKNDVRGWLITLSHHILNLRKRNIKKKTKNGKNVHLTYFIDKLSEENFEQIRDIDILNLQMIDKGFKSIEVNGDLLDELQQVSRRYAEIAFDDSKNHRLLLNDLI